MEFGVLSYNSDYCLRTEELASAVEERGFESLWVPEHTHIPVSRKSPWPGGPVLPEDYWHIRDPFVSLAAAATVTTRLKLGTGICLVVEHDPIALAKAVATLDCLSNGRFLFGVGGGWNAEEMENHGTAFGTRWRVFRERILAMKAIWTQDRPEFHGQHVNFDPIWSYPKPAQKPHPPILLGVNTPSARQRVIDYGDGWFPLAPRAGDLETGIADLRRRAEASHRDPESITVSLCGAASEEDALRGYAKAGVHRAIFMLPSAERDVVLPILDRHANLVRVFH
jgi:probable F420-dependent oxidoreductase